MKIPWLSLKQPVQLGGLQMIFLLEGQPGCSVGKSQRNGGFNGKNRGTLREMIENHPWKFLAGEIIELIELCKWGVTGWSTFCH
jgi:hypothetical protein